MGSLIEQVKAESLLQIIQELLKANNPQQRLEEMSEAVKNIFQLNPSKKHMVNRVLGRLEPTPALKYRYGEQQKSLVA